MKIQHSHFSKEFVNDYYLIHLIVILQNYMKSSRTKAHHIRLCDHPWDQFSYHTLEDDISWYPPDEQIMSYTLVNNHGRNHVQHLVRRVDYDTIPQWYQWEGSQGFKFFGVASPDATCKKCLICDSCEECFPDRILNRGYHAQMQNVGDEASTSSFRCSPDEIRRFQISWSP